MKRKGAHAQGREARSAPKAVLATLMASLLAPLLAGGAWLAASGWRLTVVSTPSMSPAVPVGALVVTRPARSPVRPGQVIVFHPPGDDHTYVHRVVAVERGPAYRTRGDNDPRSDPWTVPADHVVGQDFLVLPDVGWLVQAGGILAAATAIAVIVGSLLPRLRRWAYLDAASGALLAVSIRVHPFVRWQLVSLTHTAERSRAWLFDTGILPIQVREGIGRAVTVAPGRAATIVGPRSSSVPVSAHVFLTSWEWALICLICISPLVVAATVAWWRGGPPPRCRRSNLAAASWTSG